MSFTVTDAMVQQFGANVRHLAQQSQARLRGKVIEEPITGESAYMEQMAPAAARKATSRHDDSPVMNSQHLRRRVSSQPYDWGDFVDKADKARLLIDPVSEYAKAGGMAMRRGQDDEIIGAFFATAYTGHSGSTVVNWPNGNAESSPTTPGGNVIAVNDWTYGTGSGNAGLTVAKLINASTLLDAAEGDDEEERYIVCSSKQIGNLLATTEATSTDYNTVKALVEGTLNTFMRFTFIRSERLQKDASGYRRVCAYRKSAYGLAIMQDIQSNSALIPLKKFSTYVYADEDIGATRLEENKVVEIKCEEK